MGTSKRTLYFDPITHHCYLVDQADLEPQSVASYADQLEAAKYIRIADLVRGYESEGNVAMMELVINESMRDLGIQFTRWMSLKEGAEAVPVKVRHESPSLVYDHLVDKAGVQLITARFSLNDDFEIMALAPGLPGRHVRPHFGAQRGLGHYTLPHGHPLLPKLVDSRDRVTTPGAVIEFPTSWAG